MHGWPWPAMAGHGQPWQSLPVPGISQLPIPHPSQSIARQRQWSANRKTDMQNSGTWQRPYQQTTIGEPCEQCMPEFRSAPRPRTWSSALGCPPAGCCDPCEVQNDVLERTDPQNVGTECNVERNWSHGGFFFVLVCGTPPRAFWETPAMASHGRPWPGSPKMPSGASDAVPATLTNEKHQHILGFGLLTSFVSQHLP